MALERIPADIRAAGGVSSMSDPKMIKGIQEAVSSPVMAKCRIGHFVEAQVLERHLKIFSCLEKLILTHGSKLSNLRIHLSHMSDSLHDITCTGPVSYTHLDVYKRQAYIR